MLIIWWLLTMDLLIMLLHRTLMHVYFLTARHGTCESFSFSLKKMFKQNFFEKLQLFYGHSGATLNCRRCRTFFGILCKGIPWFQCEFFHVALNLKPIFYNFKIQEFITITYVKDELQPGYLHLKGRSPEWILRCFW